MIEWLVCDSMDFGFDADDLFDDDFGVSENREDAFELDTGRFRDEDGEFETGSPPPDYDGDVDRYRAADGRFKSRSSDLFDESMEAMSESLEPDG